MPNAWPPVHATPWLAASAAVLVLAALALTAFALRGRRGAGWAAWLGALWLAAAALALAAAAPRLPAAALFGALAAAALVAPPILALAGLRRFLPRQPLPGSPRLDGAVLAAALVLRLMAEVLPPALGEPLAAAALLLVHGHVAATLLLGPGGRLAVPLQALALAAGLAGLLPATALLLELTTPALAEAAAALLAGLALAFTALTLAAERADHQLRDAQRRLRRLAGSDAPTELPGQRAFVPMAERAIAADEPGTAALLQLEIDHFGQVQGLFGAGAARRAQQLVAQAMLEQLRVHDVPCQTGPSGFALLLRRSTPVQAMAAAERIVAAVQRAAPARRLPTLTLSVGIVQLGIGEGVAAGLDRAALALVEAQRQGRGRAVAAAGHADAPVFVESRPMGLLTGS